MVLLPINLLLPVWIMGFLMKCTDTSGICLLFTIMYGRKGVAS